MKKILVSLFIGIVFLLPQVAFGKSAVLSGSTLQAVRAGTCGGAAPIYSFAVSVEYTVNAYDNITNALLPENTTVPNGTQIRYVFEPLVSSNISWFMTGYSTDSPNGLWVNDMSTIPSIWANIGYTCGNSGSPEGAQVVASYPTITHNIDGGPVNRFCQKEGGPGPISQSVGPEPVICTVTNTGSSNQAFNTTSNFGPSSTRAYLYSANGAPYPFGGVHQGGPGLIESVDIPYSIQVAPSTNNPPVAPSLTGPTTGSTSTAYPYATQASDPDGDTVRYGIDWDNNNTVDEWTGYVASNTSVSTNHSWAVSGTYTFKALTQDSNGASSGWSTPLTMTIVNIVNGTCGAANNFPTTNPPTIGLCFSGTNTPVTPGVAPGPYSWTCLGSGGGTNSPVCTAPYLEPAPVVDLKINGSDTPITIARNGNLNITWGNIPYAVSCTGTGNNWTGGKFITGGNDNIQATAASLYTLTCTNSQGISASDSISVTLTPTLKICQNSCSSSIEPPASFSMNRYDTRNLVACHNDAVSCTDATGDVTTSATWTEGGGNPVSLGGSSPKTLTADNVGTESIQATYSGNTVTRSVTVTCTDSGACQRDSRSQSLCQKDNFTVVDNCGVTENCTGEKTCDYNWREVAP